MNADAVYDDDEDTFADCGCDRVCPDDAAWTGADDGEGDGSFQAVWLAGFQNGRATVGPRDPSLGLRGEGDGVEARVAYLRQGNSAVAIVTLDVIGWFWPDVLTVRQLAAEAGLDVDHVLVHAIHTHSAPDAMGLWGERYLKRGYDPAWQAQLHATVVALIAEAEAGAVPVTMTVGHVDAEAYHAEKGAANVVVDDRDPWIIDDDVRAARFADDDGATVLTLVNFASHPEMTGDEHLYMSADFVHNVRKTVEEGSSWESYGRDGVGGVTVYLSGALGGMMSGLHAEVTDPDGAEWTGDSPWERADADGILVGEMALDALADGEADPEPELTFRRETIFLPVENVGFHAMFLSGIFERELHHYDPEQTIDDDNLPEVETEIDVLTIGPIAMLTVPGEAFPELAIGGYDGSEIHVPGQPLIAPDNPNPPDVAAAPAGPYWKDLLGEHPWVVGLANDQLGYFVPEYDFVLDDDSPYLVEAEGHHYEETNSLGPTTATRIDEAAKALIAWTP